MIPLMGSENMHLRALEPPDLDLLYGWENDASLWAVTDTIAPYSRKTLWEYLQANTGDIYKTQQLRLIITLNNGTDIGPVDFFTFSPFNNRAELGLYIAEDYRGKGYGRLALQIICDYAERHIGLRQLYVYIRTDNESCLKLFTNSGFTRAGILKAWVKRGTTYYDTALLQRLF
mgnify:CR=1 FL=1